MPSETDSQRAEVLDSLRRLRTRATAAIEGLQDFHVLTGHSYQKYSELVKAGKLEGNVTNTRTQTTLNAAAVAGTLMQYLDDYLPPVALYQLVADFETFFFDFLRSLLKHNPFPISQKRRVTLADVLKASDKQALVADVIDHALHELAYETVRGWFEFLDGVIKISSVKTSELDRIAEIKATRDVYIHGGARANAIYLQKAGSLARAELGQLLVVNRLYVYDSADFLKGLVHRLSDGAIARLARRNP